MIVIIFALKHVGYSVSLNMFHNDRFQNTEVVSGPYGAGRSIRSTSCTLDREEPIWAERFSKESEKSSAALIDAGTVLGIQSDLPVAGTDVDDAGLK